LNLHKSFQLAVIGGGAAGFMGSIKAAEDGISSIVVLEATTKTLEKVRISGGGRCNVTNACWDPLDLVLNYPRGKNPLIGAFSRFATFEAVEWFKDRGLELVKEEDGRMFPTSNSSLEVIKCLKDSAIKNGVIICTNKNVINVKYLDKQGFQIKCKDNTLFQADKVLMATGGNIKGHKIASDLGHKIIPTVPSLFSFKLTSSQLRSCTGIAIDNVRMKLLINEKLFKQKGRVLITHKGLSGPAILKLSAFAARNLHSSNYKASLEINWIDSTNDLIHKELKKYKRDYKVGYIRKINPYNIPKRLWNTFLFQADIGANTKWSNLSAKQERCLCEILCKSVYSINGKGPYGEEFVSAGGVDLSEVNFKSMESKICKGLFFAGEILNIDGITGGFNFQHCWTSGWLAGKGISKELLVST
tara:strand:- start:16929 stop:18176 length:1248 start_codon:yes stop_codon:yes gene_type:complete